MKVLFYIIVLSVFLSACSEKKEIDFYREQAERGNIYAQAKMGYFYLNGAGGAGKNLGTAKQWFEKAALAGYTDAQIELASVYFTEKDYSKGTSWFLRAAKQGDANAQLNMAILYSNGIGAPQQDFVESMKWLKKAADQGHVAAQVQLGQSYIIAADLGLKQDLVQGLTWYRIAQYTCKEMQERSVYFYVQPFYKNYVDVSCQIPMEGMDNKIEQLRHAMIPGQIETAEKNARAWLDDRKPKAVLMAEEGPDDSGRIPTNHP